MLFKRSKGSFAMRLPKQLIYYLSGLLLHNQLHFDVATRADCSTRLYIMHDSTRNCRIAEALQSTLIRGKANNKHEQHCLIRILISDNRSTAVSPREAITCHVPCGESAYRRVLIIMRVWAPRAQFFAS